MQPAAQEASQGAIYPSLVGKRVIISGGGSGIGEGIVEAFARQGAAVAFVDIQEEPSQALVARLADAPIAPLFLRCDITDCVDYGAKIAQLIEQLGGCEALVNNGIRVNAIIPGNVQTPRQMKWYTPEGEAEIVAQQCLEGRIQPADIAAMALFLASDDARFCTAHNYWVDAGWR